MTAIPVTAAVLRDRADANHAAVDRLNNHRNNCTKPRCALCTRLAREMNTTYQSALDAAATLGSVR